MAQLGYGYSNIQLQHLSGELAFDMGRRKENKPLSNNWLYGFLRRWTDRLSTLNPRKLESNRAKCATPEAVSLYFKNLQDIISMSQGAEKSQLPEVGIEPGPQDLKANTLPRRCKSRLLPQGSRSVLYTYTYYIFPCFKLIRPRIYSEPRCSSGTFPTE